MIPRVAEGTVLRSSLDTGSPEYQANRDAQLVLLDELAEQLQLDSVEVRLKNASHPGDPMADGILGRALQAAHQRGFLNTVVAPGASRSSA